MQDHYVPMVISQSHKEIVERITKEFHKRFRQFKKIQNLAFEILQIRSARRL